jgi:anti-anti-sigma factor
MPIQSEVREQVLIVRPIDSLSRACAAEFEEFIQSEMDEGIRKVVFDFSQLAQVSSEGLLVILKLINELRKSGLDGRNRRRRCSDCQASVAAAADHR